MCKKEIRFGWLVIVLAMLSVGFSNANAETYKSPFKKFVSNGATYTTYVKQGSHTFIVDGVAQHTWAELYVNGNYISPSHESKWPFYYDPTWTRTIGDSDIIEIMVYNADNLSIWERHKWLVDKTDPTKPGTPSLASNDDTGESNNDHKTNKTSGLTFTWTGSTDSGTGLAGYEWSLDSTISWNFVSGTSVDISASNGSHMFRVRAKDKAGNVSGYSGRSFDVDTVAPSISLNSPSSGATITTTTPTFSWSGSDSSSGIWKYDLLVETDTIGVDKIDVKGLKSTSYTTPSSLALDPGAGYKWKVTAYDVAGNTTETSNRYFSIATLSPAMSVTPSDNFVSWFYTGESFNPSSKTYTIKNTGTGVLSWNITYQTTSTAWFSLSKTSGTLNEGASTTVTASIVSSGILPNDIKVWNNLKFNNTSNGIGNTTREISVERKRKFLSLNITGPTEVNERASAIYDCYAQYNEGVTNQKITPIWSISSGSSYASIDSSGKLTAKDVTQNTAIVIKAVFTDTNTNVTKEDTHTVIIKNIDEFDKARINKFVVPTAINIYPGSKQVVTVEIENIGANTRKFWIGLSFEGPNSQEWPGDGWFDVPPYQVPEGTNGLVSGGVASIKFEFVIPETMPSGQYKAHVAIWKDFDSTETKYIVGNKEYNVPGLMVGEIVRQDLPTFIVLSPSSGIDLTAYDPEGGFYQSIPLQHRNAKLYELPAHKNSAFKLKDANGNQLSSLTPNVLVLFHGWRENNVYDDDKSEFCQLKNNLLQPGKIPPDWRVVPYAWYEDSKTGFLWPDRNATNNSTQSVDSETIEVVLSKDKQATKSVTMIAIVALSAAYVSIEGFEHSVAANSTVAAYRAYLHGLVLGERLCANMGNGNLKKVHIIAHSAGAWGAYATMLYLRQNAKDVELQVTYLDPFIPANMLSLVEQSPNYVGIWEARALFNSTTLATTNSLAFVNTPNVFKSDCYWSLDDETLWGGILAEAVQTGFAKFIPGGWYVDLLVDTISPNLANATITNWTWGDGNSLTYKTDSPLYSGHSGPIKYYADSVANPNETEFKDKAWAKSFAANSFILDHTLTVNSSGVSGVSITSSTGHSGTTNYTKTVNNGTSVSLTAPASSGGMTFTGWTGSVTSSDQTIFFTMDGNKTVTANYEETPYYTLTVNSSGTSGVSITSSTGHGGTTNYTKIVNIGTSVSLTAPASSGGMTFIGWTGDVTSSDQTIFFTMDGNKTVTANYEETPYYTLTVNSSGTSGVSITSSTGHGGTTNYTKNLNIGTSVSLTAPASSGGKAFTGWTDAVPSSNLTISFTMDSNKTVTVNYGGATYTIGGAIFTDCSAPMTTGLVDVTVTVTGTNFNRTATTSGAQGIWLMDDVPEGGPYTVTPSKTGYGFKYNCTGGASTQIIVNAQNQSQNQSIQFLAEPICIKGDTNADGFISIIGDVPPFVSAVYYGNTPSDICAYDMNCDGFISIIGDVPPFVQCVYFNQCTDCRITASEIMIETAPESVSFDIDENLLMKEQIVKARYSLPIDSGLPVYLDIYPQDPTSGQPLLFTVSGESKDSNAPYYADVTIEGSSIFFDIVIDAYSEDTFFAQVITPWSLTKQVEILEPGTYTVYVGICRKAIVPALSEQSTIGDVIKASGSSKLVTTYTVGGAVYTNLSDPMTSGLTGASITVTGSGGTFNATTSGSMGIWQVSNVPEGTYLVTPSKSGYNFDHVANGIIGGGSSWSITVNSSNQAVNQSIQFLASEGIPNLSISPGNRTHNANSNTGSIAVTSNVSWSATESLSWVTITSGASGSNNGTINYTVNANTGPARNGTITVSGGGITQTFTVSQEPIPNGTTFTIGGAVYTTLSDPLTSGLAGATITVTGSGGTFNATTSGSMGIWQVPNVPEGTYLVTPSKSGYSFDHVANGIPGGGSSWSITVNSSNQAVNQSIQFLASEGIPNLSISPGNRTHNANINTGSITVTSNVSWSATESLSWVTITSGASGSNNGTINYTVNANTGPARNGTITVSGGGITRTFTVNQDSGQGTFTIGGAVYTDISNPMTSGLTGASITVTGSGGTFNASTSGSMGIWQVPNVPEGTYTVTPSKSGYNFGHVANGVPGGGSSWSITVNSSNQAANQSIQFLASVGYQISTRADLEAVNNNPSASYVL